MDNLDRVEKYIIVPCLFDSAGYVATVHALPPYGYHHIIKMYNDRSYWLEAAVSAYPNDDQGMAVAKLLAKDKPLEIMPEFYAEKGIKL